MINKIKLWVSAVWKSRTILFARLLGLLAIIQMQANLWMPYVGAYGGLILFVVAVVMEILRWVTEKPVESKTGYDS